MISPSAEVRCGNCGKVVILYDPVMFVTDLHKRALEACEGYCVAYPGTLTHADWSTRACVAVAEVGRESLAAKEAAKPAPKWLACTPSSPGSLWYVHELGIAGKVMGGFTEAQARAVAKALNETEAAK